MQKSTEGAFFQEKIACLDCILMKIRSRKGFAEADQIIHHVQWQHPLDRLVDYLHRVKGIRMQRSRISELFMQEGLSWRHEESWFGERVDPDFARKRGPSPASTPLLRKEV